MNLKSYINGLTEEVKSNIQNDFNINNVSLIMS